MSKRLLKSGMIVSAMTFISRVLGLVRDVVVANLMGAGASADVFFFANKIPNFLRRLFAEGAFSQAFVPVLTESHAQGDMDKTRELIARAAGTLGIVSIVTILGVLGSGVVTALFGFGWFLDWMHGGPAAEKFELASVMLKITFPYLWFITFVALSGAILNTLGKFAVSSFTPVFLNVMIILAAWFISPQMSQPEIGLAIGVFLGGLVQFLFQIPFLIKAGGVMVKPKWGWRDPGVVKIRTLMIPALFGVSVSQINLLFDTFIASFLQTGSISWLYYSDRLLEFPLGLFGIAIATVILPALSRKHVDAQNEGFAQTMDWGGVRMVILLGLPAMLGLMVLAKPMLMVLFMRGEFSPQDVHQASLSLFAYASGLLNFMLIKVLAPGYYSRQDTKTPVKYGIIAMVTNMVFNAIFAYFYGYVGLAIATALSAFVNMALLYRGLHIAEVYQITKRTVFFIIRLAIAGAAMVAAILWQLEDMSVWLGWSFAHRSAVLGMLIGLGAVVYLVVLFLTGARLKDLKAGTD
ncbi:LOW QUALITY PROTEIN: peptidoglycan lipid II flippase MurJ [Vibrio sp. JCM 18904]|nr:LOW QUALITY PROTEIN: peptidoglycan lipid II flippase MurJ [Vibrio sp. JCM 18904]